MIYRKNAKDSHCKFYKTTQEMAEFLESKGSLKQAADLYFKAAHNRLIHTYDFYNGVWDKGHWDAYIICLTNGYSLIK
jgi:hypothetical protein